MVVVLCAVVFSFTTAMATDIHVATTGSDENPGTEEEPLATINKAMEIVKPGDRILVHEGTYYLTERIKIPALETSEEKRCELRAYPDNAVGNVILDGSKMKPASENEFKMARCIYVNHLANYWTFYGLVLQNAKDNGMKLEGSYNIVERCVFRWNNDTGLQLGMYKDFSIEETQELPEGLPTYNPGFQFCRYNKIINCDSYENADLIEFDGSSDTGGDADGFACKLFPGPGNEFYGCRAWTNSDDNWDLYMVYHPVVIDHCWSWNAGSLADGVTGGSSAMNGNGFKLGGGSDGFPMSIGAHVVRNCVAFGNTDKGFDQNNGTESMYLINCVAWGNARNYVFSSTINYGTMYLRNCVGWGASTNRDFGRNSVDEQYNSWTISSLESINDFSNQFESLLVADFKAAREADGSLPNNGFAKLRESSVLKDKGTPITDFTARRYAPANYDTSLGTLELLEADKFTIPYNGSAPDLGAYEYEEVPTITLTCTTDNATQEIKMKRAIDPIVYEWNEYGKNVEVSGLAEGLTYEVEDNTVTISGKPQEECTFTVTVSSDNSKVRSANASGTITFTRPTGAKILTGDWYPFQDDYNRLPADLQNVLELIPTAQINTADTKAMEDQEVTTPSTFTRGAVVLSKLGGIRWNLAEGVVDLKLNLYFTGGRFFTINYTLADGTQNSITTSQLSKGCYTWDVLAATGISKDVAKQVRTIELINAREDGGGDVRVYDMLLSVPVELPTILVSVDKEDGVSTYCPEVGVDFTDAEDIAAYKASVVDNKIKLTRVYDVAAGEGVLIRSLEGGTAAEYMLVDNGISKATDNAFVGTLTEITVTTTSADGLVTNYVLSKKNNVVGFYKANPSGTKVAAGKAYLPVATANANAAALNILFDDDNTTGIIMIPADNGQRTDKTIYNLNGQRVTRPTKGVYIVNGKKVVIK